MSEDMTFLPKSDLLTLEELSRLCGVFIDKGVKKIRITGGEPLMRKNIMSFIERMGGRLGEGGLDELTLTTNASQLTRFAKPLYEAGIRRLNVSIDTLDPVKFEAITRWGKLTPVLQGVDAALQQGLKIKINTVALRGINEDEIETMIHWAHTRGMDLTLIETMPLGDVGQDRTEHYLPLSLVRTKLSQRLKLTESDYRTPGPARYFNVKETGGRLGFITPLTHNFCESCNRVRLTCTGTLYMCLGQEDKVELREILRHSQTDSVQLDAAIEDAVARKPKGHDFVIDRKGRSPAVPRHMSMTGG
jgi:cyclic pyranopterin phosphate synthase